MSTPQKMQHYMEKHRLSSLFEDLMNKVLHDQPDNPMVYMIKVLYRKAGMDIPTDLKLSCVRRSSPERIIRRSKSPEMAKKTVTQAWGSKSVDVTAGRSYDRPWQTHTKKPKMKEMEEQEIQKPGRKQKPQVWNADNKVGFSSFDEIFEESPGKTSGAKVTKKSTPSPPDARKAWATIGLDGDEVQYSSTNYRGPRTNRNDDDPLAGEIMNEKASNVSTESTKIASVSHVRGRHIDAKKHRKQLEQLITEKSLNDSGYTEEKEIGEADDAIELLEDGEELRREGARNISSAGYKLSRVMRERQQEANVKLNIKFSNDDMPCDDNQYRYLESEDDRPPTGLSGYQGSPGDSDEEFESVSQVTGPRRPVWNVVDSDGESYIPKPSRTLPEPSRSKSGKGLSDRLASSMPVKFKDSPYPSQSMESADSFLPAGKTWTPRRELEKEMSQDSVVDETLKTEKGGWSIPKYESDASILDWSTTDKSVDREKPRVY